MKHVSILVPAGDCVVGSVEGPHKLFSEVNVLARSMGKPPVFNVQFVGVQAETPLYHGLFTLKTDRIIAEDLHTDLIIIPAPHGDMREVVEQNRPLIDWIKRRHAAGAEVASLCMGAFLLAATGLMDGKKCATHWGAANDFRQMFPAVKLVTEKVITDEQGLYSSGGAYSYLNLILYLIDKYAGHDMAVLCSKLYLIDIERSSQSPFIIFKGQKQHEDEPIKKVQDFIETNFRDKITVEDLASMSFLGRRNFERRFKKATSNTVAEYIQRVKIEAAKMSLESSRENVNEVMYNVGYSDNKAFRRTFKKITGLSPVDYRNKYSSRAA